MGDINDFEKVRKELEQLKAMGEDDAVSVVRGYHEMLCEHIHNCAENLKQVTELSPATFRLTKTAFILAERDFMTEKISEGDEVNELFVFGGENDVTKLVKSILKQCPQVLENICREAGYVKA